MIWNIIDNRKRRYRWLSVNAVIEGTDADNSCEDSDQMTENNEDAPMYQELKGASLHEAVEWAESAPGRVTLYLYDQGDGIR